LGVVIALLSLIATGGAIPRWAVIALGGIGFISFSIVAIGHGWLKAPSWLGVPIRVFFVIGGIGSVMFFLCWTAWPLIRRHLLDAEERERFKAPLEQQRDERYEIQIACPSADEASCIYATQFIDLFREVGWKIQDNQVQRVTLGRAYGGTRLFEYVEKYPPPDAPTNQGVWTLTSSSLVSVYRAFSAVGIEPDEGIRDDVKPNILTIYFGSERSDESQPTQLSETMKLIPEDYTRRSTKRQ
jgi:hypothetical protein